MATVLDSEETLVLQVVRTVCLAIVMVIGLVVTCQWIRPIKADSQECTDLCTTQGVKRFYDGNPYLCECETKP